ncbi:hypothetical protein J6590_092686 [Homalodisca vitripennis]|nr:hypothetical protein J6590_092686 [Homalodisca vitripennis]
MNYTRIRVGCKLCEVTVYKKNWKVHKRSKRHRRMCSQNGWNGWEKEDQSGLQTDRQTEYIAELENLAAQMTSISKRISNSALQHLCRSRADKKAVMTSIDRCLDRRMAYDLMVADDHVNILLDVRNYARSLITALGTSQHTLGRPELRQVADHGSWQKSMNECPQIGKNCSILSNRLVSVKAKNILAKELFLFSPPPAVVGIHMKLCVLRRDLL